MNEQTQTPADPSAYRVDFTRNACGTLTAVRIVLPAAADGVQVAYRYPAEEIGELIACAREEERGAPDAMPSDRAFVCAVLRAHGLPILGEDDEEDGRDTFVPHPRDVMQAAMAPECREDADAMGAVTLRVVVNDTDRSLATAADLLSENQGDEEACAAIEAVARGVQPEARIGGGAAPLVVVTRHNDMPLPPPPVTWRGIVERMASDLQTAIEVLDPGPGDEPGASFCAAATANLLRFADMQRGLLTALDRHAALVGREVDTVALRDAALAVLERWDAYDDVTGPIPLDNDIAHLRAAVAATEGGAS